MQSVVKDNTRVSALGGYGVFAALLSAAGLPIYIHAPKFYVDEFGVSLGALGAVLFALRLLDVVQDPLLGKLAAMTAQARGIAVVLGVFILCGGMIGLFAIPPMFSPVLWFAIMLTLVFSAFSFLTISFYAQGVGKADGMANGGHLRLARWRETGALLGVCLASIAPFIFLTFMDSEFTGFALAFAVLGMLALALMRGEWSNVKPEAGPGFRVILQDIQARRLLLIALVNAAPVAVSSTLFLFFVESRLDAPGQEGVLLLLFFLSAAVAAPIWGFLAQKYGIKPVLLSAMILAVFAFAVAISLTLLPAAFATRMAKIAPNAAEGFGLWALVSKLSLAFAAVVLLPMLERAGFTSGGDNTEASLWLLTLLYAAVPCGLKCLAIALLATTQMEKG
jgi:GPH family glycoside/pentoside/hexuronide:cation symporter